MQINYACVLPVTMEGQTEKIRFLICNELASEVTLGKTWLREQKAVHDHELDCLYIGAESRRRVFLTRDGNAPPELAPPPPEFFVNIKHGFPTEHAHKLKQIIESYADVFFGNGPLRQTPYVKHDIELTDDKPIRLAPYRYSTLKKKAIQVQVRDMLADGLIEPSSSPYSSPIVLAKKKDGEFRFCVDYRRLNAVTKNTA